MPSWCKNKQANKSKAKHKKQNPKYPKHKAVENGNDDPELKYKTQTLLKLKFYIKHHTLIVGDFNSQLSALDRSVRQKFNWEIR